MKLIDIKKQICKKKALLLNQQHIDIATQWKEKRADYWTTYYETNKETVTAQHSEKYFVKYVILW